MTSEPDKLLNMISSNEEIALDTETNGINWNKCHVCGYGVSDGASVAYVPVRHGDMGVDSGNIGNVAAFELELAKRIDQRSKPLLLQNSKFDMHMSANHVIKIRNIKDTMSQGALINENQFSFSLENLCKNYDIPQKKGKDLYVYLAQQFGCKPTRESMAHFHRLRGDDRMAYEYACGDNLSTWHLNDKQQVEIKEQNLEYVANLENKLTPVLYKMERRGIKIDMEECERVIQKIDKLHTEAFLDIPLQDDLTPINVRSQKDLKEYFQMCGIDNWPMTAPTERFPEGQASFKKNWLGLSEEGMCILNARKYATLKSMFLDNIKDYIHNGRIHTNFNQTYSEDGGTKSGRLSSNSPNMQFIPKRDEFTGKILRAMYIADPDFVFVEFDYSQCEPCLFTHYSKEPTLLKGYNSDPRIDMHMIAAEYMNIDRKTAKNLNLGIMYVMGAAKLAAQLGVSYDAAHAMVKHWHKTFRKVSDFTKNAAARAETRGYVMTILGRRARFPDPRWSYRAANRIVQGGAADILKYKMIELDDWLTSENYHDVCHMLLNIHDAILFQIHKDYLHLIPEIERIMCDLKGAPFNLSIPFKVDFLAGGNWSEASYKKAA